VIIALFLANTLSGQMAQSDLQLKSNECPEEVFDNKGDVYV
jgi:hypothetical protein